MNKRLQVCEDCKDRPSLFLRPVIIPADPPPIYQPRAEPYTIDEAGSYPPARTTGVPYLLGGAPLGVAPLGGRS
jgi:hypothetical protein